MSDPLEGVTPSGAIRTGVSLDNVSADFRPIHAAAIELITEVDSSATLYACGSVVTGRASAGASDVDLLSIGLTASTAKRLGNKLSARFADRCRSVDFSVAQSSDFGVARDVGHAAACSIGRRVRRPSTFTPCEPCSTTRSILWSRRLPNRSGSGRHELIRSQGRALTPDRTEFGTPSRRPPSIPKHRAERLN